MDLTQQQAQRVPTIVDLPSQQHLPVVTNQSAAVAAASQLYQSASANNKVSDKAYIYPQEQSNSSMYPALPPPPPALPPRLNTAGLARSITTSTTHGPSSSSSSSSGLTTINPLNPVYNPSSTYSTGHGAFYNANNIYPGTSATGGGGGGDDTMIGTTHNGYIQPGSYGGATASYHHKADLKHLTTPIPTPAPAVAAPSSSKAAAALAWENSRLGAGNGIMSRVTGGHYNAAASQRQHYAHYYPLPQVPPPPPQQQQQQQHQHQHQHHQQLPSPHGRIPQGSALPMGVAASSHDYGGQYNIEPTGRMGLHADLQLAPSQAVAPRGYYDGPGMMSSVGTSNTISSRGTGLPMNDTNRGMYGLGKQSHPTQYRHY